MTTNSSSGAFLLKHMMSGASDACLDFQIDETSKTVRIVATTQQRQPFIPATLLQNFLVGRLAEDYGISAWDDDAGARSGWTVLLAVGAQRFTVSLIKQLELGAAGGRWALELYPVQDR